MKAKVAVVLFLLALSSSALAVGDIAIGPFFGMNMPLANKDAKSGSMFGFQAKFSPIPFVAGGLHFQSRKFGDPSETFFYGSDTKDGGKISSVGFDLYLGKTSGVGPNFYFMGSIGSYSWKRDNQEKVSKTSYAVGPGLEIVLPVKVGIEGRALFEVVPTGDKGSWKNILWFLGVNYHLGLGPM